MLFDRIEHSSLFENNQNKDLRVHYDAVINHSKET